MSLSAGLWFVEQCKDSDVPSLTRVFSAFTPSRITDLCASALSLGTVGFCCSQQSGLLCASGPECWPEHPLLLERLNKTRQDRTARATAASVGFGKDFFPPRDMAHVGFYRARCEGHGGRREFPLNTAGMWQRE